MPRKYIPMAIVYDFDGTLAPDNVQERQFIPDIGMKTEDFWAEVDRIAKKEQADRILIYMYLMLEKARAAKVPVALKDFKEKGHSVTFFEGVKEWFDRINQFGRKEGLCIEHYILSSGNAEIIEGTDIACKFKKIYASRFLFDENGVAVWPSQAVNYTTKTQYLFRINKGALDLSDDSEINRFVEQHKRPMPFENMVYIGDGATDVPCFRLVKDQGGLSIAVFRPHKKNAQNKAQQLFQDGRVHNVVSANYQEQKDLDRLVKAYIRIVAARYHLAKP